MGLLKQITVAGERKEWSAAEYHDREIVIPRNTFVMPSPLNEVFTMFAPTFLEAGVNITAYFYASHFDKKVYKITPAGVVTIFKSYTTLEPYGCAVDSINGRLFVMCGDTAAQFQIDRFDDLSVATGASAAASISSHTAWGGEGFYEGVTDMLYWFTTNGSPDGFHKIDGDMTDYATLYTAVDFTDGVYWPPDDEVYGIETGGTDELYTGELDGTSWADSGGNFSGTASGICVPPAHLMGTNEYILIAERVSGRIDRYTRAAGSRLTWLDISVAGSAIQLLPRCPRIDYVDDNLVFIGHDNSGTGAFGLYSIPLQEAAQAEANLVLIADLAAAGSTATPTTGQGLGIHYSESEVSLMVDV